MEKTQCVYQALRRRLTNSATLAGMVVTTAMTVEGKNARSTYPAITFRVISGTGKSFKNLTAGDIYISVWSRSDNYARQLASIYGVVYDNLHECEASLSTTNLGVGLMAEETVNYPLYEQDIDTHYLASRWRIVAQKR